MEFEEELQHIDPKHPPDEEDCDDCSGDVNDPVDGCLRFAEIEHDGIVARGRWWLKLGRSPKDGRRIGE